MLKPLSNGTTASYVTGPYGGSSSLAVAGEAIAPPESSIPSVMTTNFFKVPPFSESIQKLNGRTRSVQAVSFGGKHAILARPRLSSTVHPQPFSKAQTRTLPTRQRLLSKKPAQRSSSSKFSNFRETPPHCGGLFRCRHEETIGTLLLIGNVVARKRAAAAQRKRWPQFGESQCGIGAYMPESFKSQALFGRRYQPHCGSDGLPINASSCPPK